MTARPLMLCALAAAVASCARPNPRFGANGDGDSNGDGGTAGMLSDGGSPRTGSGGGSADGTTDAVAGDSETGVSSHECGNGIVEPGEDCDDDLGGCTDDCTLPGDVEWEQSLGVTGEDLQFRDLALLGPNLIVVGQGVRDDGSPEATIARYLADDGTLVMIEELDPTWIAGELWGVDVVNDDVYVAGAAQPMGRKSHVGFVAQLHQASPADPLVSDWLTQTPGSIARSVLADSGDSIVVATGRFMEGGYGVARVAGDGSPLTPFWISAPGSTGRFRPLAVLGGELIVGGSVDDLARISVVANDEAETDAFIDITGTGTGTNQVQALGDVDGDLVAAGFVDNTGTDRDAWIARYDDSGAEVWRTEVDGGSVDRDEIEALVVTSSGSGAAVILAAGMLGTPTVPTLWALDPETGNEVWRRQYPDSAAGGGLFRSVVATSGAIYVAGRRRNRPGGDDEAFVLRLSRE